MQIFIKISVIKNFAIFKGKHLCWSLFLRKLQVLKPASHKRVREPFGENDNVITSLIWFPFFSNSDFPTRICCHFFRTTLFWEKLLRHTFSEYLLRHNSYFFGTAVSSKQLLFSPFSEQSLFCRSYLFRIVSFSERNF